jgi:hypothetical protein
MSTTVVVEFGEPGRAAVDDRHWGVRRRTARGPRS